MKEQLEVLLQRDYGIPTLNRTIISLLEYSDDQLTNLLVNTLKISDELALQYLPGVGFRCWNINQSQVGVLPIAGLIERKLNQELLNKSLNS